MCLNNLADYKEWNSQPERQFMMKGYNFCTKIGGLQVFFMGSCFFEKGTFKDKNLESEFFLAP